MIRLTVNAEYKNRVILYFAGIFATWLFLTVPIFMELRFQDGNLFCTLLWFLSYAILCVETAYAFTTYVAYFFVRHSPPLSELDRVPEDKSVAIICPARNEDVGLYERLRFSLNGNLGKRIDFWLLSDSDAEQEAKELEVIECLREDFNGANIFYRRREDHIHFKPGNISEWLYCQGGKDYNYFFVLDADSVVMPGTIEKLLRKAEHPQNKDIGHFQCRTAIVHDYTHLAHFQKTSLEIYERLVFSTIYGICGQWISYGHSNLINVKAFMLAAPPTDELSHDVWDAAVLDRLGYRSVMVKDVNVYEEAPANFLVAHKRDKRWTQGSLSALKILEDNRVSVVERWFVLHGGLQYTNNVVFFFWLTLLFINMVFWNNSLIVFRNDFSLGYFAMNKTLLFMTVFAITTFVGHPFLVARSKKDVRDFFEYLIHSNLMIMTHLVTGCFNVLGTLVHPVRLWVPMEKDPFAKTPALHLLKKTIPTSLISMVFWVLAWQSHHPWWLLLASHMLFGGVMSPVICWWSGTRRHPEEEPAQKVSRKRRAWFRKRRKVWEFHLEEALG